MIPLRATESFYEFIPSISGMTLQSKSKPLRHLRLDLSRSPESASGAAAVLDHV